jgi:hypothetical protein
MVGPSLYPQHPTKLPPYGIMWTTPHLGPNHPHVECVRHYRDQFKMFIILLLYGCCMQGTMIFFHFLHIRIEIAGSIGYTRFIFRSLSIVIKIESCISSVYNSWSHTLLLRLAYYDEFKILEAHHKWFWGWLGYVQGRIQGRRQSAPGHPLGSLKNKGRMVKNKISFDPNILFIWTGHPLSIVSGSAPGYVHWRTSCF